MAILTKSSAGNEENRRAGKYCFAALFSYYSLLKALLFYAD